MSLFSCVRYSAGHLKRMKRILTNSKLSVPTSKYAYAINSCLLLIKTLEKYTNRPKWIWHLYKFLNSHKNLKFKSEKIWYGIFFNHFYVDEETFLCHFIALFVYEKKSLASLKYKSTLLIMNLRTGEIG